jgi:hypothetical protein
MVARFVVLAALIVVADIGGTAAQQFMMGQGRQPSDLLGQI